jgi:hypothetical protein
LLVFRRIAQKVVKRVVDRTHHGLVGLVETRPRHQNPPDFIAFKTKYDPKLPFRKEWAVHCGLQALSDYITFSFV